MCRPDRLTGLAQSRWLASYNAWGDWLNASYTLPDGQGSVKIGDAYGPRRERMFRRCLLSVPQTSENNCDISVSLQDFEFIAPEAARTFHGGARAPSNMWQRAIFS